MTALLDSALTRRNSLYLNSRKLMQWVLLLILMVISACSVFLLYQTDGTGISMLGSFLTALVWLFFTAVILVCEFFFPYGKIIENQSAELYLSARPAYEAERYLKDVMQVPYRKLRRLILIETVVASGAFVSVAFVGGIMYGFAPVSAYRIVMTVFTAVGLVAEVCGWIAYKTVAKKYRDEGTEQRAELKKLDLAESKTPPKKVRSRDLSKALQFGKAKDVRLFKTGRWVMLIGIAAAVLEIFIPMPVLLGEGNDVGIWATMGTGFALLIVATVGHILQCVAIKRNTAALGDGLSDCYRRVLSKLSTEYYARYGRKFALAFFLAATVATILGVLGGLEILPEINGMPSYFVMVGIPLLLVVLVWFGVDCLTGYNAFKQDYHRFEELLRPGLLPLDTLPPDGNERFNGETSPDLKLQTPDNENGTCPQTKNGQ